MRIKALVLILSVALASIAGKPVQATDADGPELGPVTNLPLPRYVSLRSSEINVRRGPGLDYRKDWVFQRAGLPVRVVEEYGDWRKIIDMDDAGGWVYHAMITGRRTVVVQSDVLFREQPADSAAATAKAEQGVIARLRGCAPEWCQVEVDGHEGWVPKGVIWGVDPSEVSGD
ncbi:MAG: SH3 domain-containing protein [Pseudomonadota bacterium]